MLTQLDLDAKLWEVIDKLGMDGTSSDEMDSEDNTGGPQSFLKIPKPWRNT